MASIITFTFREAVADVEYNGKMVKSNLKIKTKCENFTRYEFVGLF